MSMTAGAMRSRIPHADLWALGILFFTSRVPWILEQFYYSDSRAAAFLLVTTLVSLLLIAAGYAFARFPDARTLAVLMRSAVLAMFLFNVAIQLRQLLPEDAGLKMSWKVGSAVAGLVLAGIGGWRFVSVWPRLRAAMLAATIIFIGSAFALAATLAQTIGLFGDPAARHRPVVVLLLDEFSAGSAQDLIAALAGRQLQVESWAVPSVAPNTLDAIPAIFSGVRLEGARPCTDSAICGRGRAVDFARMSVSRRDVDMIGVFHPYCAIEGLRHCVIPQSGDDAPVLTSFLCEFPLQLMLGAQLGCDRGGVTLRAVESSLAATRAMFDAPFWKQGGLLYAHLLTPHPPSASQEPRLADAYAANLERARKLVLGVVDGLDSAPFRDDYTLVVTSDHHLRSELWCKAEPYSTHGCELPEAMRTAEVPFIIATRGAVLLHKTPRSNGDLLPIVVELSRPR